ncbi:MAG: heme o synthase, partial [Gammaproteobacteria bacterium]|nr:heme o synthase [Gammaproteobacteria bacterium]
MTALSTTNRLGSYFALCKPRVVSMIVFTAMVGMLLSTPGLVPLDTFLFASLGIGLAAASAAAINHVLDRRIDERMSRTRRRPLPQGILNEKQALSFAMMLGLIAMLVLVYFVNPLTALLTFCSLIGYAVIYTAFLKHATPQNIVIGGAAGAAPPVLGWTAISGQIDPHALLLFVIIFTWTPPHFWALAISRRKEYMNAGVPMLPVTHGEAFTRLHILLYTLLLVIASVLPYLTGMSGAVYLAGVLVLDAGFLYYAVALKFWPRTELP